MKHIILDALAVENDKTGVGQYIHELLLCLLPIAPAEIRFTVLINATLDEDHPFVRMIKASANAVLLRKDIPAIGAKRDLLFIKCQKEFVCDLFHCLYSNNPLFFKGTQMVTIHDLKYVIHPEYMGSNGKLKSLYLKNLMHNAAKRCSRIVAVSESTKADFLKIFSDVRDLDKKTSVIYEGASLQMEENSDIFAKFALERPYFLYLGELRPHKNVKKLVDAFIKFKERTAKAADVRLIIAGKPHKSFDLGSLSGRDDIVMAGYVRDEYKYTLYSHALAYCLPSLYEGFGLPILEAMKCGAPVITSNFSSTSEVSGDAGILVDPLDADDISAALERVYCDAPFRKSLVERGYAREKEFSWGKAAEETLRIYKEILGL